MAAETSIKLTYEDYLAIPDDGRRHEIIDGEHYVNPAPNFKHQIVVTNLIERLSSHVRNNALGRVVCAPCDVLLDRHTVVQPDVLFISNARASIVDRNNVKGAPDLLVEVLSSDRDYDERVKYQVYELAGVEEYWIIDPYAESAKIFRRTGNRFSPVALSEIITTPLLPDFQLRIADLFL
ncbi:MAG: Uma2 family endonuclease [Thermoanaerobaculia bacterium]